MSIQLTADQIMPLAHTICNAAGPPFPEFGPGVSMQEQANQVTDWLRDSDYTDEYISIAIGGAHSGDGCKSGFEVVILLSPMSESEEEDTMVFVGYELFDIDADPDPAEGRIEIEIFRPGPWVDHLLTVARRTLPILQARGNL